MLFRVTYESVQLTVEAVTPGVLFVDDFLKIWTGVYRSSY